MCSCVDERITSEQGKKDESVSHGSIDWTGHNMMAHAILFKRNVEIDIVYLIAPISYIYYIYYI